MHYCEAIRECLQRTRGVSAPVLPADSDAASLDAIAHLSKALRRSGHAREGEAVEQALWKCREAKEYGGLGFDLKAKLTDEQKAEVLFQLEAHLQAVTSREQSWRIPDPLPSPRSGTKPMTLAQKIFAHHAVDGCPVEGLQTGDLIRVAVDWIIASELSYMGIKKTMDEVGQPGVFRNDRFWLAGDHVYDPRIAKTPRVQTMYQAAEKAKRDYKMTEYQGMNYTIMHTEFVRQRSQPGMLVIGADSHTCSAGAVGCLAIGLGAIDVAMALITGETWFKIPESIRINFTGRPRFGTSGKDVILHILKVLRRNTVATERIVEFAGAGSQWLSTDARFAICNMCTEFGAVTGVFCPDELTQDYISRRPARANKPNSVYFRPDEDAQYAGTFEFNLSEVESTIALYPSPDNVVPLSEKPDTRFDGVFIGACTTTEEELILAGLILQAGLAKGLLLAPGKRHVVPGSLPIVETLRKMGLLEVYEAAAFSIGLPGCSYCAGMAADQAGNGEVWLSSQNRNFRNRMGTGSIGNITSAAVVAASAFSMSLTHPASLISDVDETVFRKYLSDVSSKSPKPVRYVEPHVGSQTSQLQPPANRLEDGREMRKRESQTLSSFTSKVIILEDFIDTDALAPAMILTTAQSNEEFGDHCLEHTHPDFRRRVREGQQIVVAGKAFGVGSSREEAVRALMGLGVKAVIARSFAFIYSRNQPSLGLLGIEIRDEAFYRAATDGAVVTVDVPGRVVRVGGEGSDDVVQEFPFSMSEMERRLLESGGISTAYRRFKREVWRHLVASEPRREAEREQEREGDVKQTQSNKDHDLGAMVDHVMGKEEEGGLDHRLQW